MRLSKVVDKTEDKLKDIEKEAICLILEVYKIVAKVYAKAYYKYKKLRYTEDKKDSSY